MLRLVHLMISAQVLVSNWEAVLAVTIPFANGRVDMIQFTSHATMADLPMPWPDAVARRMASTACTPSKPRARTCLPRSSRNSQAHRSGP